MSGPKLYEMSEYECPRCDYQYMLTPQQKKKLKHVGDQIEIVCEGEECGSIIHLTCELGIATDWTWPSNDE